MSHDATTGSAGTARHPAEGPRAVVPGLPRPRPQGRYARGTASISAAGAASPRRRDSLAYRIVHRISAIVIPLDSTGPATSTWAIVKVHTSAILRTNSPSQPSGRGQRSDARHTIASAPGHERLADQEQLRVARDGRARDASRDSDEDHDADNVEGPAPDEPVDVMEKRKDAGQQERDGRRHLRRLLPQVVVRHVRTGDVQNEYGNHAAESERALRPVGCHRAVTAAWVRALVSTNLPRSAQTLDAARYRQHATCPRDHAGNNEGRTRVGPALFRNYRDVTDAAGQTPAYSQ